MIEDNKCFINEININKYYISIYVSEGVSKYIDGEIVLNSKDIGDNWCKHIFESANKDNDEYRCSEEDKIFLSLYVLFSLKKRVYISDVVEILGYEFIENNFFGKQLVDASFEMLENFLNKNGYEFRFLSSAKKLYRKGAFPYYKIKNVKCIGLQDKLQMLLVQNKYFFKKICRYVHQFVLNLIKMLVFPFEKIKFLKNKISIIRLNYNSESGSLFYKTILDDEQPLFVKKQTILSDKLDGEYNAAVHLEKIANDHFILPIISKSKPNNVIYQFNDTESLKDILSERKLSEKEVLRLTKFFAEVLDVFNSNNVIHRDITPGNILVYKEKDEIIDYKLADFGMSVINRKDSFYGIRQKEICKTCGGEYRFSFDSWDDAASAWAVCLNSVEYMTSSEKNGIDILRNMIGINQYTIEATWQFV